MSSKFLNGIKVLYQINNNNICVRGLYTVRGVLNHAHRWMASNSDWRTVKVCRFEYGAGDADIPGDGSQ